MILTVNSVGKIVLKDVTDEARAYIEGERKKQVRDPEHSWWYFSREYEGTYYVTVTTIQEKSEFVKLIRALLDMGMETTEVTAFLVNAWQDEAERSAQIAKMHHEKDVREAHISFLHRILKKGCGACRCFACKITGDDVEGYCSYGEKLAPLDGVQIWSEVLKGNTETAYKFFPREDCIYLKEEKKWKIRN